MPTRVLAHIRLRSPYPGLRPFNCEEAPIFFGREEHADSLLEKLQDQRFLAVVGQSGSGKSSLVKAGLIPALEQGLLPDAGGSWRIAEMRPGDRPLVCLADTLAASLAPKGAAAPDLGFGEFLQSELRRGHDPDQLPLLQHLLMRMWLGKDTAEPEEVEPGIDEEGVELRLNENDYLRAGGFGQALSGHANEVYNRLTKEQKKLAEVLFRRLTERGTGKSDTRRPAPLVEIAEVAGVEWEQLVPVVDAFRAPDGSFLTPRFDVELSPERVIDISHESLIRHWDKLKEWVDEEAESALRYRRLAETAGLHAAGKVSLWRDPDLQLALDWCDKEQPTPVWAARYGQHFDLAMQFLDASAAQQRAEQQRAEAARQRELRQARKQVTLLVLGLIVALGLTFWAISAQRQAERSEKQALLALKDAETAKQEVMQNFRQATSIGEDFLTKLDDEKMKNVEGFEPVRKELGEIGLKHYREFTRQRGNDPSVRTWVWYNLGVSFRILNRLDDAIAAYRQQTQVKPDHEHAWYGLGIALYKQGKMDEGLAAFQKQVHAKPDQADVWLMIGMTLWKQGKNAEAATAYAQGLTVHPRHLSLLSNDAELALAEGDIDRLHRRVDAALPQVTPKDELFVILPFLAWLANPNQGWTPVMAAINTVDPGVKFTWDFSDTSRAITRLDMSTQQAAQHFIDFFEGRIDLPTLQARLAAQ